MIYKHVTGECIPILVKYEIFFEKSKNEIFFKVFKSLHSIDIIIIHKFTTQLSVSLISTYEPIFVKPDMMPTLLFWDVQFFIGFFDIVDIILI